MAQDQLTILMFPGLDGTGRLFAPILGELPAVLVLQVVQYPTDRALGYDELVTYCSTLIPWRRRFVLLGESFSGPLVLQLAAREPEGLMAVILVASFHRRPISRLLSGLLRRFVGVAFSRPPNAFAVRCFLAGLDAPGALIEELREATSMVQRSVLAARVRAALSVDATDALAACRVPILYIGGAEDRLLRRGVLRDLHAVHPAAEAHILAAPHLVLQRHPREAAALIGEFLARAGS
jgi:pimeloyl-ACP methyl ester carboxylesterase